MGAYMALSCSPPIPDHAHICPPQADRCVALNEYERLHGNTGDGPASSPASCPVVVGRLSSVHDVWATLTLPRVALTST